MDRVFENRHEASVAAAEHIAKRLTARLNALGKASLVVSGGTTPAECFTELSEIALDWQNIHVLLSDERWVPADDDASNEKLVRDTLLQKFAREAPFLSVYEADTDIADRCIELGAEIRKRPFPFACANPSTACPPSFEAPVRPGGDGEEGGQND